MRVIMSYFYFSHVPSHIDSIMCPEPGMFLLYSKSCIICVGTSVEWAMNIRTNVPTPIIRSKVSGTWVHGAKAQTSVLDQFWCSFDAVLMQFFEILRQCRIYLLLIGWSEQKIQLPQNFEKLHQNESKNLTQNWSLCFWPMNLCSGYFYMYNRFRHICSYICYSIDWCSDTYDVWLRI